MWLTKLQSSSITCCWSGGTGLGRTEYVPNLDHAHTPPHAVARAWQRPFVPGDRVDRFEILSEIGRGGFGVV